MILSSKAPTSPESLHVEVTIALMLPSVVGSGPIFFSGVINRVVTRSRVKEGRGADERRLTWLSLVDLRFLTRLPLVLEDSAAVEWLGTDSGSGLWTRTA